MSVPRYYRLQIKVRFPSVKNLWSENVPELLVGQENLTTDGAATATTWLLPNSVCHLRSKLAFKRLRKAFTFTAPLRRVPRANKLKGGEVAAAAQLVHKM